MAIARGIRNNNPLNIRKGEQWRGLAEMQTDRQFAQFKSMSYGIRAAMKLVVNYISGNNSSLIKFNTPAKIIRRWAPPNENATEKYIDAVCEKISLDRNKIIYPDSRKEIVSLLQAMAWMETGSWLSRDLFESAYDLL